MKFKLLAAVAAVAVFALLFAVVSVFFLFSAKTSPQNQIEYVLKVAPGSTVRQVASELASAGIIRSKSAFYYAARFSNFVLRAGRFTLVSSYSVFDLLNALESTHSDPVRVGIPEGYTITQIAVLLEKNGVTIAEDFISAAHDAQLLASYRIPAKSAEGYLFPDTYFFDPLMKGQAVVRLMIDTFFNRISFIEGIDVNDPQKLFNIITLASIVEREYRVSEEAPLMASVFSNRLKYNIGLESCATIVYILTEIEGRPHPEAITYDDLKIDSNYNTYKWAGLPPGPISNPGLTALSAAANPPVTDYYYFRLTDPQKGTHNFTATLSEHVQAGLSIKK